MSEHVEWVHATEARPTVIPPQAYPAFDDQWADGMDADKGYAAFVFGIDDLAVIYGKPRDLLTMVRALHESAERVLHGYVQPGCYVGPDNTPWRATHAEGDPCEKAVTTHDCPRTHTYEPVQRTEES